jgi:hypothetical protein
VDEFETTDPTLQGEVTSHRRLGVPQDA